MTRKKVKLAYITNDSARKATYKKRKRGLLKKMDELTTLCDVKACAILYSPYEARPVVWPGPLGAREVIASYKRLPEMEKAKKMVSQEEFLRHRIAKVHEQLKRQQKENREKDMSQVMYQCLSGKDIQNLSLLDLSDLGWVINQHLGEIKKKIETLTKENSTSKINNHVNSDKIYNNNDNKNKNKMSNNNDIDYLNSGLPPSHQVVGPKMEELEGLNEQKGDHDAIHMQMLQPWPSFMDMLGPPSAMHDHYHHHHPHHGIGIEIEGGGGGFANGSSGIGSYGSTSTSNNMNIDLNMMMMMGQFGDYQLAGHGVNPALWSNNAFLP